jgi:predicted nucleic acid-binding protein
VRYWDTSALVPLLVDEETTHSLRALLRSDPSVTVWWGTGVECASAIARRSREAGGDPDLEHQARRALDHLATGWTEVIPSNAVRENAERLLYSYPLRAADAIQLGAAQLWSGISPVDKAFVCTDSRLRAAAAWAGFSVLP